MTSKEFIEKKLFNGYSQHEGDYIGDHRFKTIINLIQEFAKYHVKKALEAATENSKIQHDYYDEDSTGREKLRRFEDEDYTGSRYDGFGDLYAVDVYSINKESILNSYPEENIK